MVSSSFATWLGGNPLDQFADDSFSGEFYVSELSFEDPFDLLANQPVDSFALVTLSFEALADSSMDGQIIIGQVQVPEPTSITMLVLGLCLFGRFKRKV